MKITTNKKAYYDYFILEEFNCGIILTGIEVKSIRLNNVTINDSFGYIYNNEVWLKNMNVSRYKQAHMILHHDEKRDKKLLLNRKEINKIIKLLQENGTTMIPLEILLIDNKIKVKLGIVKGKKLYDKKESIKENDIKRDMLRNEHLKI